MDYIENKMLKVKIINDYRKNLLASSNETRKNKKCEVFFNNYKYK